MISRKRKHLLAIVSEMKSSIHTFGFRDDAAMVRKLDKLDTTRLISVNLINHTLEDEIA